MPNIWDVSTRRELRASGCNNVDERRWTGLARICQQHPRVERRLMEGIEGALAMRERAWRARYGRRE